MTTISSTRNISDVEEPDIPSDMDDDYASHNLSVMRCILTTPRSSHEWKRYSIFSLYFRSGEKSCKLIIDSGSCMNVVFEVAVLRMKLTPEPHPTPYQVSWVNKTSIPVTKCCLVPLVIKDYVEPSLVRHHFHGRMSCPPRPPLALRLQCHSFRSC
ncbi:hypothetical protein KSP39_PZI024130 [Platanthera zijinensis]|uniref:Uncharacterized protein n=1 Tax=Platanthera zijinensis TaxID=2320716 RepID=A0AAP0AT90_9ASPA